jgi:hypothetical protein
MCARCLGAGLLVSIGFADRLWIALRGSVAGALPLRNLGVT